MANQHRGDVDLVLGGETLTLRLTLSALAEVEAALGAEDLAALGSRLSRASLSARDIILFLGAAARGGGHRIADKELAARISASELPACIAALGKVLSLTFSSDAPADE